ncbi:glycoside hydrolase family 16 protein [Granulosicoccus antarcticus]|uniref:Endo-1,3-1,4-beta-glycanase ExsH n=1 Tax=Granulosicoccus antarcticus IMCC3135 TaxID=1192854 RepID=A0A2Z2NSM9_9GAMM|nr:glycoside hydrolase family 16 protein [Granulosicoccus antarcticus]ASJ74566.1 Endo-1,3-1,4-beta-glycanase ExsH [Granulosicoccus antarcticus IMCC3135]
MRKLSAWLFLSVIFIVSSYSNLASASPAYTVEDDSWTLISLPLDPGSEGSIASLFGDDLSIDDYSKTWVLFGWEILPATGDFGYVELTRQTILEPGKGYWFIQATGSPVNLTLPATLDSPVSRQVRGCSSIVGCSVVGLKPIAGLPVAWNMIGFPRETELDISGLRVISDSGACNAGCTLTEAYAADIMFSSIYSYTDETGSYDTVTEGMTTQPWTGFWVAVLPGAEGIGARLEVPVMMPPSQIPDLSQYRLEFSDEFDGPVLDSNKWNTGLLWGPYLIINQEEQVYIDSLGMHAGSNYDPFSFTPEGTLKITASATSEVGAAPAMPDPDDPVWDRHLEYRAPQAGDPPYVESNVNYLSGLLNSYESFKFTHGYVETRAKVPAGKGLWPAFWLLPSHYVEDVPEIDVMEFLGQNVNEVYHTYHYFDVPAGWKAIRTPSFQTIGPDFSRDFHVYSMSWDPAQIIWYVDGLETRRIDRSEYKIANQAMYLIANLAVGGSWPQAPDSSTVFPAVFEIDYIRAYSKDMSVPLDLDEYELVFSDEFNGASLDASKWNTRFIWGPFLTINKEEQYYVDALGIDANSGYSPFTVANGNLTIRGAIAGEETPLNTAPPAYPRNDPYWANKPASYFQEGYFQKQYTSGIITSWDSFKFTHGYAEIKAQIPVGDGLWPAFWLLNRYYVGRQPEIDIMEILGENPGEVIHSYHRRNDDGVSVQNSFRSTGGSEEEGFGDNFHTFGVQWTDESISWYVDGELKHTYRDSSVAYQVMYVLINLAVGGSFNTQPVDQQKLPADYIIDYVRVYQQKPVL